MQAEGRAGRVLVVDLDVHQGDGTAAIFADDDSVFTCSMHGRAKFPFRKSASDLDVELDDGTGDAPYLASLRVVLPRALDRAQPDLVIYLAGADPYEGDRLGRLSLTKAGLAAARPLRARHVARHPLPVASSWRAAMRSASRTSSTYTTRPSGSRLRYGDSHARCRSQKASDCRRCGAGLIGCRPPARQQACRGRDPAGRPRRVRREPPTARALGLSISRSLLDRATRFVPA